MRIAKWLKTSIYRYISGLIGQLFKTIRNSCDEFEGNVEEYWRRTIFQNHTYTIQKYFDNFDKNELFFTNPTSKTIKFSIENKNFKLKPNWVLLVEIKNSIISIKSNCLFFRPTIFSYKGKYFDVHHS